MWPERTDPYKFVYEDVAIATYLMASDVLEAFFKEGYTNIFVLLLV